MLRLLLIVCLLALASAVPAAAQPPPAASAAASPAPAVSPAQARQALDVLNDPKKRAQFTATLEAIVKGLPAPGAGAAAATTTPTPTSEPVTEPPTFSQNGLGAEILVGASGCLNHLSDQAL